MTSIINLFPAPLQEESLFSLGDSFTPTFIPTFSQDEIITPLLLEEILLEDKSIFPIEEKEEKEEQLDIFQILQEMYEAPPEAGETTQRSGFSSPTVAKHNPFPLHYAAGRGDVAEINKLILNGANVNAEDARSAIPLAIATIFGRVEAVKTLLKAGAIVNDRCYEGHTALHIALDRKQYDVARILLQNGADPKLKTWQDVSATTLAFSQLEKAITAHNLQNDSPPLQNEVNEIISTLEVIVQMGSNQNYLNFPQSENNASQIFQIPLSVALKTAASSTASSQIRDRILKLSESMFFDNLLAEKFVQAKNLLASFPTGKVYTINSIKLESGEPFKIIADGHYKHYTIPLAKASLDAFVSDLTIKDANENKIELFNKIHEIFAKASESVMKTVDPLTAKEAYARYLAGETILLPTQFHKQFIDVLVSKKQGLLAIANTGERYALDADNITLHDILKPEMIVNKTLTNKDKVYLEFHMLQEFQSITKLNTLNMPNQIYGNSTWESHRNAVKELLYIELRNQGHSSEVAEKQAHEYFKEWDSFHGKYMLDQYLSHDKILPANALGDIYLSIQKKKASGEFTQTDASNAKILMKTLTSSTYQSEFKAWKKSLPQTDLNLVNSDVDAVQSNDHSASHDPIKYIVSLFARHPDTAHKSVARKLAFEASPLHVALDKKQYDVARTLLQNGANPKLKTWQDISATTLVFSQLEKAITAHNLQKDSLLLQNEVNEIISTVEVIAEGSNQNYLNFPQSGIGAFQIPLSVALKSAASITASSQIRDRILKLSESMSFDDSLAEGYVRAKNLLSSFPTGKTYTINNIILEGGEPFKIMADGHYKHYTTPLAKASIDAFVSDLTIKDADENKIQLFNKIHEIFAKASESVTKAADPLTAKEAYARYLAGETVLLPTQCDKHFIDVIISKKQGLLAIANTGERYALDAGGIMLHDILKPEMIDATFMNKILTNKDRMYMEFYMLHEFGPITKLNTLNMPNQIYGNCTWESHRNAVKGLLYIELRNQGHSPEVAEKQAHEYFKEWDSFHGKYMLAEYLSHDKILPANALGDIYLGIQKKKAKGEFTQTDASNAKTLMKTLTSDTYQSEFKTWKKSLPQTDLKIVNSDVDAVQSNDHPAYHDPIKYIMSLFAGHPDTAHKGVAHKLAFEATPLHMTHHEPLAGFEHPHHEPDHFA